MQEQLSFELARAQRYQTLISLIICDIDHFQHINDNYGHDVGDEVLRLFARIHAGNTRSTDTVARWGGEEFIILPPVGDATTAVTVADKMRQLIGAAKFPQAGGATASFGVSLHRVRDTQDSLFRRADEALYHAKRHGRNQVCLHETNDPADTQT